MGLSQNRPKTRNAALLFAIAMVLGSSQARAADVEYAYDPAGRLVGVIDGLGEAAQYVYDAAGNITEIRRFAANMLSLIEFAPRAGPVGSQITIWGTGFSTTAANNAVTVNGAGAAVVSATKNKLVVTVPAGAATGNIAITVSAANVVSSTPFTVTAALDCATRLSGLAPAIAVAGATTTVSGSGFDRGPNIASINGASAISSATSSTLTVTVPAAATSGRLMAMTAPVCPPTSAGDLFVPPSPYTAGDIGATGRLSVNGAASSASLAANKKAIFVFDGKGGQPAGVAIAGSTLGQATVELRAPDGSVVSSASFSGASAQITPVALPFTGGYTVFVNPTATTGGSFSVQVGTADLMVSNPSAGSITTNQNGTFNVPVAFTVSNNGVFAANPSWSDYVYVTPSPVLTVDALVAGDVLRYVALAAGGSYAVSQTFVVTGATPGPHYIYLKADGRGYAQADGYGSVMEFDEINNLARVSVTLPTYPDLSASAPTVGSIVVNQNGSFSIPVGFSVTNVGTNPAPASWTDWGYLSSNGVLDATSLVLQGTARTSALAGGAMYNVNQTYTASGVGPGTYTLLVKTDGQGGTAQQSTGMLVETSESNNVNGLALVLPGYPDLSIGTPTIGAITVAQNGTYTIPVSFVVSNSGGSTAAASWNDYVYLSTNGLLDASSTSIGVSVRTTALAAGATYTVNKNFTTTSPAGTYTLFAKTDAKVSATAAGVLTEASEANNTTAGASIQLPALPDLEISNPSVGTITKNTNNTWNIPVTFTVTNNGGSPAQPNWTDFGYLSANGALDSSSSSIGSTLRNTALAASASYTLTLTFVTAAVAPGSYTVFVKTDGRSAPTASGFVAEGSETNNTTAGLAVTLN